MREESIPFTDWEFGVDGAEYGDEVVLKGANGSFSSVSTMFMGGYPLELDVVLLKCLLEVVRAFVVKDVEVCGVSLEEKHFVSLVPSGSNGGALTVWDGDGVNCIGIIMIQHEDVLVAACGDDGKLTSLIGISFE